MTDIPPSDRPEAGLARPAGTVVEAGWQQRVIDNFAYAALEEQRRARRWGIFFKLLVFAYLIALLLLYRVGPIGGGPLSTSRHTALIEVNGLIAPDSEASADNIVTALREAFENKHSAAVVLRINSPGGSPVQAGYVNDEIVRLREQYP